MYSHSRKNLKNNIKTGYDGDVVVLCCKAVWTEDEDCCFHKSSQSAATRRTNIEPQISQAGSICGHALDWTGVVAPQKSKIILCQQCSKVGQKKNSDQPHKDEMLFRVTLTSPLRAVMRAALHIRRQKTSCVVSTGFQCQHVKRCLTHKCRALAFLKHHYMKT